jgi:hypothetical protein
MACLCNVARGDLYTCHSTTRMEHATRSYGTAHISSPDFSNTCLLQWPVTVPQLEDNYCLFNVFEYSHRGNRHQILESNDRQLQQYVKTKDLLTWFELRRITSSRKRENLFVKYKRSKQPEAILFKKKGAPEDAALLNPHPWYLSRFLVFRPIGRLDKPMPCRH